MPRNPFKVRLKLTKEIESDFKVNLFRQNIGSNLHFKKERAQKWKISPFLAEFC